MPPTASNVVMMPKPSNPNAPESDLSHRSTQPASALEKGAGAGKDARAISAEPCTEVFAVFGVEPEIQAYAMAKYSRSALSMKESLREISTQKAEKFLNTFYFQYGHRSIADLGAYCAGHREIVDSGGDRAWPMSSGGTGRSGRPVIRISARAGTTRPISDRMTKARKLYRETLDFLFAEYDALSAHMTQHLINITPKPADMKQDAYERTLKARAFDITRYLLPLATNTSLGRDRQCAHAGEPGGASACRIHTRRCGNWASH